METTIYGLGFGVQGYYPFNGESTGRRSFLHEVLGTIS